MIFAFFETSLILHVLNLKPQLSFHYSKTRKMCQFYWKEKRSAYAITTFYDPERNRIKHCDIISMKKE
jgi:hypothetical protein